MKTLNLTEEQQREILLHIIDTKKAYKDAMSSYMERMKKIHEEASTFTGKKEVTWHTNFKVNKLHEIVNKVLPKLIANNPKWIVSSRITNFADQIKEEQANWSQGQTYTKMLEFAESIQDYLTMIFDKKDMRESVRLRAKGMVKYGNSWAKVCYRYKIERRWIPKMEDIVDDLWQVSQRKNYDIVEDIVDERPSIDIKNVTDVLYDPRYVRFEDMPAIIDMTYGVRLWSIKAEKKKYMNIDKLDAICSLKSDGEQYKKDLRAISGINSNLDEKIKKDDLTLCCYYWYFDLTWEGERVYEFHSVSDVVLLYAKEIAYIPFEDIKCFEDTESHFAVGYVEPILWLQEEMNHKKNAVSISINQSVNRTFIWSPQSWINPKQLDSAPGRIITSSKWAQDALANCVELPFRPIPWEYFSEQNDFERQIQALTFTIDASTPRSNQWLTQTATGIRVKEFESNSVNNEVRSHLEEWLERLAYKLLQVQYENMEDNIRVPKRDWTWFREINKEALGNALSKYTIKVETGSSSYDSIDRKREDAIAKMNLGISALNAWVQVDMTQLYKDVMSTFEGVDPDKLIAVKAQIAQQWLPQLPQMPTPGMAKETTPMSPG